MMATFYGADVEQLRRLGRQIGHEAEQLGGMVGRIGVRVAAVQWNGPDANRFRSEWHEQLSVALRAVSLSLAAAGMHVNSNANEQEATSQGGSSVGSLFHEAMPAMPFGAGGGKLPEPFGDPGMTPMLPRNNLFDGLLEPERVEIPGGAGPSVQLPHLDVGGLPDPKRFFASDEIVPE